MTSNELAQIAYYRTSAQTLADRDDSHEGQGECPECEYSGEMVFDILDEETAVGDCPECGEYVRKYIGYDAA